MNNNVPYLSPSYAPNPAPQQIATEFHYIQGKQAAQSYPLMPGVNGIFFDTEVNKFYIKNTNYIGVPTPIREFEYTEILSGSNTEPDKLPGDNYVTKDEYNELLKRLDDLTEKLERKNNFKKGGYRNNEHE